MAIEADWLKVKQIIYKLLMKAVNTRTTMNGIRRHINRSVKLKGCR